MRNANCRVRGESQKNIVRMINGLEGRHSRWDIWQDFIIMSALSIANVIKGPYWNEREKMYLDRAQKYSKAELDVFGQMLAEVVMDMEREPDQDFLGELFMSLGLGNEWKGQFFTPYNVCRMMSAITVTDDLQAKFDQQGWVSVSDSACGAGALLIAFANECRRRQVNYQTSVLFVAQDVDFLAACMCYTQLSLMGCPGYVVVGDTLANPSTSYDRRGLLPTGENNVWYTPLYFQNIWQYRKIFARMDIMMKSTFKEEPSEEVAPPPPAAQQELNEVPNGQLMLF